MRYLPSLKRCCFGGIQGILLQFVVRLLFWMGRWKVGFLVGSNIARNHVKGLWPHVARLFTRCKPGRPRKAAPRCKHGGILRQRVTGGKWQVTGFGKRGTSNIQSRKAGPNIECQKEGPTFAFLVLGGLILLLPTPARAIRDFGFRQDHGCGLTARFKGNVNSRTQRPGHAA